MIVSLGKCAPPQTEFYLHPIDVNISKYSLRNPLDGEEFSYELQTKLKCEIQWNAKHVF